MQMTNGEDRSTQALVEDTIAGNHEAFSLLVDRYRDAASAVAYSYLGGFDDVQDAVQEAFVHAYCNMRQLREPAQFGPWLRKITANVCAMSLRKRERSNVSLDVIGEQASTSNDARKIAARAVVREALSKLSEATRLTVTLSYINGYSHAEIADFLEMPITAVRSRLRHAKRKLREEMIEMVEEVLHEDKPGGDLARKILQAFTCWREAMTIHADQDALQCCDDALAALHDLSGSRSPDELKKLMVQAVESEGFSGDKSRAMQKLTMRSMDELILGEEADIMLRKAEVLLRLGDVDGAKKLFEQAVELSNNINNNDDRLAIVERIGHNYHNAHECKLARQYLPQAIEAAKDAGDAFKEAINVWCLANTYMDDVQPAVAKPLYERACALFEKAGWPARAVMSRAAVNLIDEVGEDNWASVIHHMAFCIVLRRSGSSIEITDQGGGWVSRPSDYPWQPMAFSGMGKILDTSAPVGSSWQKGDSWLENGPLNVSDILHSYNETVIINEKKFEDCALIETLTTENKLPDAMSDEMKACLRSNTGSLRRWYAPGVGLIRLVARNDSGYKAVVELQDSEIVEPNSDYMPLAIGNSWTYSWVNAPEGYTAKERCRVAAVEGEHCFLENYRYVIK